MDKVSTAGLGRDGRSSPKGKYGYTYHPVTKAMSPHSDTPQQKGGFPFDVCIIRVPPGKMPWPYHRHAAQWEFYQVLEGSGVMRVENDERIPFEAGDFLLCRPGEAHQIINDGDVELVIVITADNPIAEVVDYPDSGKVAMGPPRRLGRLTPAEYYDGEE
ncbi:cupin domain-containing protein [Candidatus Poribacteria bacterium]|nr:cupin domain-containing protein [Candidatus Poribacteria bacterium]